MEKIDATEYIGWTGNDLPRKMLKYWHQRYSLFSKFDDCAIDVEGWYSVTPEEIAKSIASRCKNRIVIDAFCGVGGNSIQFAMVCKRVIAIDIDPVRLACAKHNAKVYNVSDKIDFILGDFIQLAPTLTGDVIFLSPPWGGPDYLKLTEFDINLMPINGTLLFTTALGITRNVIYYLPRNTNQEQLAILSHAIDSTVEIEEMYLNDKLKAIIYYYGNLVR